jgi:ribonuclease HI
VLTIPPIHIGYVYIANMSSRNVTSAAWVIFSPSKFLDSRGIFLGHATNNIAEYEAMIIVMTDASALGIQSNLVVWLDSKLLISQLTSHYSVHNLVLYRKYLRVRLLECSFDVISYEHIPREINMLVDSLANEILD